MSNKFETIIEKISVKDPRYKEDAYIFVMDALGYIQKKLTTPRHITGEELLKGIKDLLIKEFGPMSMMVLKHWGINNTEDFGNVVFNLVQNKVLSKTDDDSIDAFKDVFDFEDVFDRGYRKKLNKKISRMRGD